VDGQNLYALICSPETSAYIKKSNPDLRQDLRFSSHVDELLKPFGVGWSYGGYIHLVDNQAPRFNFSGGTLTRVPFYSSINATYGKKAVVNPAYNNAPYEVSFIFNKEVMIRVPDVITNPGGKHELQGHQLSGQNSLDEYSG
jgi:hypothetical protein